MKILIFDGTGAMGTPLVDLLAKQGNDVYTPSRKSQEDSRKSIHSLVSNTHDMDANRLIFGTGASSNKDYDDLKQVIRAAMESGIFAFDTAPSYGTEKVLGRILKELSYENGNNREKLFIQTKIDAWQMQESDGKVYKYVETAMKKLGVDYIDSLLIHWPVPEYFDKTWECFSKLKNDGIVRKTGICNIRFRHLKKYAERGALPDVIQIERNPLRTCEKEIAFCLNHGIEIQAYSPLCKMDERLRDSEDLKEISQKYDKSLGQTVLRWHMDTGVTPVFTSKKPKRVKEYAGIFDFKLSEEDIALISSMNIDYKMYLESIACPGL